MTSDSYEVGFALGRHWALRDATADHFALVRGLGDGREWIRGRATPAIDFVDAVAPGKADFFDTGELPTGDFVSGFIDGAKSFASGV